jgi:membrane protein implicated in regulation of membrane protease activity
MQSPFRSEAAAFRFLLITIGAFALIALASAINVWLGLAVFVALSVAAIVLYVRQRGAQAPQKHVEHVGPAGVRRILVLANETVGGDELLAAVAGAAQGKRTEVLVVVPALNSRLKHWTSDEDDAREEAQVRLELSIERLAAAGIAAHGAVGDDDPLQAADDALRTFGADEIIISTHPPGRSNWLEQGVVEGVGERFDVPVTHVVVDLQKRVS